MTEQPKKYFRKEEHKNIPKILCIALICFILILVVYLITLPKLLSPSKNTLSTELPTISNNNCVKYASSESTDISQSSAEDPLNTENISPIEIDMSSIYLNELGPVWDHQGRIYPDPNACVETIWNESDIVAYFGSDLTPIYLPEGIYASPENSIHEVILSDEGNIWEDTVWLYFAHDFEEDGSRKLTDNVPMWKGFTLIASKIGIMSEYMFHLPQSSPKVSKFGETDVYIGYQSMGYGPYEERTGYYDYYVAIFQCTDIEYQLAFSQIELEEVVKVIASIIYDADKFIIKNNSI